jgi:hypothetical protein
MTNPPALQRLYNANRRARQRAAGLCVECPRKRRPGLSRSGQPFSPLPTVHHAALAVLGHVAVETTPKRALLDLRGEARVALAVHALLERANGSSSHPATAKARGLMRAEPWIVDPATHPRRYVSLRVAAHYLEVDRRTLNKYLAEGLVEATAFGERRKVAVTELTAFEQRQRVRRRAG